MFEIAYYKSNRINALADFSRRHIEVSQHVTNIRVLHGEMRLLEWNN
jgi:hypothetical protein